MAVIKDFRLSFSRVPPGNNVREMSPESHLILEVGFVDILGSEGEEQFGNPKDVEEEAKVKLWVEGLRMPGGNGWV